MTVAVLGTAGLFGAASDAASEAVLDAAWSAGFRAFDTAPRYGHGRSEAAVGERVRAWPGPVQVTSKAGLEPEAPPSRGVRAVKAVARRLPPSVQQRIRPGSGVPRGRFDADLLRRSLDRTLLRLGAVDRMMLHEAHAENLTDDALAVLERARDRGDVGQVGVATVNGAAAAVARRAPGLVTAAHVEVGPFAPGYDLPAEVTTVVGHGVLGPGADGLRRLADFLSLGGRSAAGWAAVTDGTRWAGTAGLADALVARAAALPLRDVIVATSRPDRLARLRALAAGEDVMPPGVEAALAEVVSAARQAGEGP